MDLLTVWERSTYVTPPMHFLCSKSSIFLTTYPPLNANVICEGSLMKLLYLGHGQSYCRLFLFLLSFCDLLLWEFCNILKRFYSGFFTSNFLILATNNDGIQHDRQPTHSNYFWSFFFHNDFSKKSGERWTLWVFFLIILSWILFGVIGSDFIFSYLALKVISSTRPVGNFCASLMGSEACSEEFYSKKRLPFHFLL